MSDSIHLAIDTAIDDLTRKVLHHKGSMSKAALMIIIRDHHKNTLDAIDFYSNVEDCECCGAYI